MQQEQLSVLQAATPGQPEQRNLALRIVLAGVGGLFFSLGIVFVWYLLDDRFVSVRDIKDQFGETILGLVPQIKVPRARNRSPPCWPMRFPPCVCGILPAFAVGPVAFVLWRRPATDPALHQRLARRGQNHHRHQSGAAARQKRPARGAGGCRCSRRRHESLSRQFRPVGRAWTICVATPMPRPSLIQRSLKDCCWFPAERTRNCPKDCFCDQSWRI